MSKQRGRGGIGSKKHGRSGKCGPSPRQKLHRQLEANKRAEEDTPRTDPTKWHGSVREALASRRKKR